MHSIKRQARRNAWYGDASSSFNPFARVRTETSGDVESSVRRTHSAPLAEVRPSSSPSLVESPGSDSSRRPRIHDPSAIVSSATQVEVGENFGKDEGICRVESEALTFEERRRQAFKRKIPFSTQFRRVVLGAWVDVLFVFVPAGFAVNYTHCSSITIFCVNFIAIVPSAHALGFATEEVALRFGDKISALLNMTFGNAVQLITSIFLLKSRQIAVLKSSLLGNILSNLLLTTGLCFLLGGINRVEQYFNQAVAQTISMLLLLAVTSLVIPTASHLLTDTTPAGILSQSRGTSVVVLVSYGLWMLFQLKSNRVMFEEPAKKSPKRKMKQEMEASRGIATIGAGTAAVSGGFIHSNRIMYDSSEGDDEEEIDEPSLSLIGALITLVVSVTLVAFNTQFTTDSIQSLLQQHGLSQTFLGLVILPILNNDATSIVMAIKDKMDISIALTLERCMQTSLLVVPLTVLLAWCMGVDAMTLQFEGFPIAALFASIIIVTYVVQEGKSNWLTGALLIKVFIIISLSAYYIH